MSKIKVFIFGNDKSIQVRKVPTNENKAVIKKDWEVNFDPEDIFEHQQKGVISVLPFPFPIGNAYHRSIIVREGRSKAEKLSGTHEFMCPECKKPLILKDMFGPLTIQENATLIKRLMAKSKLVKSMTNLQLIIMFGIIGIIILQIITLAGVRVG